MLTAGLIALGVIAAVVVPLAVRRRQPPVRFALSSEHVA